MSRRPLEVAIVGGGCAAITTAFELTRPEHRGRYQVSVYQLGWRLGGKGASGRGAHRRIEEHGLHLWMGYYENAFRLLRECYAELGRERAACRFADWSDAFFPDSVVSLADPTPEGPWSFWTACFPPTDELPGDPFGARHPFTLSFYLVRAAEILRTLLVSAQGELEPSPPLSPRCKPFEVERRIRRLLDCGRLATLASLVEAIRLVETGVALVPKLSESLLVRLIDVVGISIRSLLETLLESQGALRRVWSVIDFLLAVLRGVLRFGLLADPRGLDAIDEFDGREWLGLNGASQRTLDSTFLRSLYDLGFAYVDGDSRFPRMAAGQFIRGTLRMFFTYRGALFWKMRAGMGDVVFAPFYEVLARRGVRFFFFHRLENVRVASAASLRPGERPFVEALEFDVQAQVRGGGHYRPLVDVRGLPCWPAEPDWKQLEGGERLRHEGWSFESHWDRRKVGSKTLKVTDDFDFVVLGVSLGAIPFVCGDLLKRDPRWRTMVEQVKTVATQAFQLWLSLPPEELGWRGPPVNLTGFVEPFDTWADMRQLVAEEDWPDPAPRGIAYFCNVLPTPEGIPTFSATDYPVVKNDAVRSNAIRFLNHELTHLWPEAVRARTGFRWELLVSSSEDHARADEESGERSFDSQFWTANVNPSDRYVLSLPGTQRFRISPLDNTYDNLTLAGDWTDCGHNQGCVESAVMSGRLAAHAISGAPRLEEIVGYDHP